MRVDHRAFPKAAPPPVPAAHGVHNHRLNPIMLELPGFFHRLTERPGRIRDVPWRKPTEPIDAMLVRTV
jgi:hypothetical protein